ncbi:MAG: histidine phosphatase family protein [Planctomycetota bacterium]|nr:MAG: histidine phosphatase family protein [Planctomycetota bacterium]
MLTIYMVRHGETDANVQKIFRGRLDPPLNDRGRLQAEAAGEVLRDVRLSRIYSSPLRRARETAAAIAEATGAEITASEKLIDIDFGDWQGKRLVEVKEKYFAAYGRWVNSPASAKISGGESLSLVQSRAMDELRDIAGSHMEGSIALVSHRVTLKTMMLGILDVDLDRFRNIRLNTACISIIEAENGEFSLVRMNDTYHLTGIMKGETESDF